MDSIVTFNQYKMFKNYVDDKTDEGFKIDGENLTYREGNEIIIAGLNSTQISSGNVEGVEISNGKIILSPNVLGFSDITLQKATGSFRGSQFELVESHFTNTSVLSAQNNNLEYNAAYDLDYTLTDSDTKIIYTGTGKPSYTIFGAGNDADTSGVDIQNKDVTISAEAINEKDVTINANEAFNFKFDGTNTITNAVATSKISVSSGSVKNSVPDVTIYGSNFDASVSNAMINLNGTDDTVTISGGTNSSYYGGVGGHFVEKDFLTNHNAYIFNAGDGNTTIKNLSFHDSLIVNGARIEEWDNGVISNGDSSISIIIDNPALAVLPKYGHIPAEAYVATSSNEEITLSSDSVKSKKEGATVTTTLKPKTKNAPVGGVRAGAGNDSITVSAGVAGMSIYGGRGNDIITIDSGAGGNIYIYESGDGQYTIYGWKPDEDLLVMTSAYETAMSADGNDLLVKIGSGYVALKDLNYGDKVKVLKLGEQSSFHYHEFKKIMQGTQRSESIFNTDTTLDDAHIHRGNSSSDYWVIDGGAGNDSISNIFDYVSINAGADQDKIFINSSNKNISTVTSGVSIRGGEGNDTIDVSADTLASNDVTIYGGHVYEFGASDGYDSIIGFNGNDTLLFDSQVTAFSADVNVKGDFVIHADNTVITLVKPENRELCGTKLNVYTKTEGGTLTPITSGLAGATAVNQTGTNNFDHYEIPKNILLSNSSETLNYGAGYDNYTVNAQGGADKLTISGAAMSINCGSSNDSITLTGGTNVNSLTGALLADKTVTIQGGAGNDYIDASSDFKVIDDTTYRAAHVYEVATDSGIDSIFGFNEYDTIKIIDSNVTVSNITTRFDTTGKFFILKVDTAEVYIDVTQDYFKGGKTLNIVDSNGDAIAGLETSSRSAAPLSVVSLTAEGFETTDTSTAFSWKYIVPRILQGSGVSDTLVNTDDYFTVNALQGDDEIINSGNFVSISGYHGDDTITNSGDFVTINGGLGNDSINNTGTNTTYIFSNASEGNDTITGFNQDTDLIHVQMQGAYISFTMNVSNNLVANINKSGTTYTTIILDGVSSGSVRYKIGDGEIQTYTIT